MTQPKGSRRISIDSDLSTLAVHRATQDMPAIKSRKGLFIMNILSVPSQVVYDADIICKEWNNLSDKKRNGELYFELNLEYSPDEWSMTRHAYWFDSKEKETTTIWSPGA